MSAPVELLSLAGMPVLVAGEHMRDLMRRVARVAQTTATVLITGESGTGKEAIARALHYYSLRCAKPWVDINCAALPDHLVESELFGYDRGAFSGADSVKQGLFELANTGTLFLDEIGELDRKLQVKLLRVLDGTPYYRLGGVKKISVDVRVVAATNQDLEQGIRDGVFRCDLYHRISQIHLNLRPLRERRDEIVPLAEFLLRQHGPQHQLSAEAAASLESYNWPGNIRELRNVITRAIALADGPVIEAAHVACHAAAAEPVPPTEDPCSLELMERRMIRAVLAKTGGHQKKAAELLGISSRTLSRKLKLYDMEGAETCVP